jgi:hypothetical protein
VHTTPQQWTVNYGYISTHKRHLKYKPSKEKWMVVIIVRWWRKQALQSCDAMADAFNKATTHKRCTQTNKWCLTPMSDSPVWHCIIHSFLPTCAMPRLNQPYMQGLIWEKSKRNVLAFAKAQISEQVNKIYTAAANHRSEMPSFHESVYPKLNKSMAVLKTRDKTNSRQP